MILPDGTVHVPLAWEELVAYERQQGGYWLYGPWCDVYGKGKIFVRVPGSNVGTTLERLLTALPKLPETGTLEGNAKAVAMLARGSETHQCALCGQPAVLALVAEPGLLTMTARWLDLCAECGRDVRVLADSWDDDEVTRAWDELIARGLIVPL